MQCLHLRKKCKQTFKHFKDNIFGNPIFHLLDAKGMELVCSNYKILKLLKKITATLLQLKEKENMS